MGELTVPLAVGLGLTAFLVVCFVTWVLCKLQLCAVKVGQISATSEEVLVSVKFLLLHVLSGRGNITLLPNPLKMTSCLQFLDISEVAYLG